VSASVIEQGYAQGALRDLDPVEARRCGAPANPSGFSKKMA
jgi:hypothetical protein